MQYDLVVDFELLLKQKTHLLMLISESRHANPGLLDGLIGLIDTIQDQAVDIHGISESKVFPITQP